MTDLLARTDLNGPSWLRGEEWQRIATVAERREYPAGSAIVAEGDRQSALYLVTSGFVRIERAGGAPGIAVARLGIGEAFGEMSLLEDGYASASVIAEGDVSVDVVPHEQIQALLEGDAAFAARFYRALATTLSSRLRATSARLAASSAPATRSASPVTGLVTDRQIPGELAYSVAEFRARLWDVEEGFATHPREHSARAVADACDALVFALATHLRDESLVEAGYNDLMAFRDPAVIASGFGAFVFREVFPLLMTSATIARMHATRPFDLLDVDTVDMMLANAPSGDGPLGALIDGWFLSRATSVARRGARGRVAQLVAAGGAKVLSIGCRSPRELIDSATRNTSMHVTLLDGDEAALRHGVSLLRNTSMSISPILVSLQSIAEGASGLTLEPQDLIYGVGVADVLDDEALLGVLRWACATLVDGGKLVLDATLTDNADRPLMDFLVGRPVVTRTADALRALVARSPFGRQATVERDDSGATVWMTARSGGARD